MKERTSERLKVLKRMAEDLDWLYNKSEEEEEKRAVSFVEDTVHGWINKENALLWEVDEWITG